MRLGFLILGLAACTEFADPNERADAAVDAADAGEDAPADAGVDVVDASDCIVPPEGCPPLCARESVTLGAPLETRERIIVGEVVLDCEHLYDLGTITYVEPGATLTIQPGVVVQARTMGALVVQAGGRLVAEGTAEEPVVFTSLNEEAGSWAGVVMLGRALVSTGDSFPGENGSMLLDPLGGSEADPNERASFGGDDPGHDCGSLRYTRIEYAGALNRFFIPEEIPGLTLAGCGDKTRLDYVQVHASRDEATNFIGGGFPVRHIVTSEARSDALQWNRGWTGSLQYAVAHLAFADANGNAVEGRIAAFPFPDLGPAVANVTMVIPFRGGTQGAMYLTAGSGMRAYNMLSYGSSFGLTVFSSTRGNPGFFNREFFTLEYSIVDDDVPFTADSDVGERVDPPNRGNRSADPGLSRALLVDDLVNPNFQPSPLSAANEGAAPAAELPSELEPTTYIGAIDPNGEDWTAGWTRY
ncbi:MAG: hypothetical protein AAGE52_31835 [Myxococcota bacterium]